jgi:hypothetical protein
MTGDLLADIKTFDKMHYDDRIDAEEQKFGEKLSVELKKKNFEEAAADIDLKLAFFSGRTGNDVQYSDVSHMVEDTYLNETLKDGGYSLVGDNELKDLFNNISTAKSVPFVKMHSGDVISVEYVDGEGKEHRVFVDRGHSKKAFDSVYALGQYYNMLVDSGRVPAGKPL